MAGFKCFSCVLEWLQSIETKWRQTIETDIKRCLASCSGLA